MVAFTQKFVEAYDALLGSGRLTAHFEDLRTEKVGVSAGVSGDFTVSSGEANATRMPIDDATAPYFDDFDELDTDRNLIVLGHDSQHELVAHAHLDGAGGAGEVHLEVQVNGETRAVAVTSSKNGESISVSTSVYLKLAAGDEVEAVVWHTTGADETFPADESGNFVSCVRQ